MNRGVILYGPPASGKDTITAALHTLDPQYELFQRLKAGPGRTLGYRMTTEAVLDELDERGLVVWQNRRYGARYVIDLPTLAKQLEHGIPVLHAGQREAIDAISRATPQTSWFVVSLWCPRGVARQRIAARNTGDANDRLTAWDETPPLEYQDLVVNTAAVSAEDAAHAIHRCCVSN